MTDSRESKVRAIALRHAYDLEDKKRLQREIIDLVIECFDLPHDVSKETELESLIQPADIATFKRALSLFQPSDFDDLIYERNVDNRCGYALCRNPKKTFGIGEKVWNRKSGSAFKIVPKQELERFCSTVCAKKAGFVKAQLSNEPAWAREVTEKQISLLQGGVGDATTSSSQSTDDRTEALSRQLRSLALERGDYSPRETIESVSVVEREHTGQIAEPPDSKIEDNIENYAPKRGPAVS